MTAIKFVRQRMLMEHGHSIYTLALAKNEYDINFIDCN